MKKAKKIKRKIILGVEYKWCYKCKRWKSLDHFYKNKSKYDNKSDECKECSIERSKLRYVVDPEVELPFCECGCDERVSRLGNRFINHHNTKGKNNPMLGKNHPEEVKQKISKNRKGLYTGEDHHMFEKNHPEEVKQKMSDNHADFSGENNPMFGKTQSKETRQKMSDNHIDVSGENNPNWRDGSSYELYCSAWLDKEYKQWIRGRDRNVAWDIGYWYKGILSIHHINHNKKECRPKNLITLSVGMNAAVNFHREFYTEWFQIAMNRRLGYKYANKT